MEAYILFYKRKALHREEDRSRILTKYMSKPLMQIYDKALMVYISRLWFCRWKCFSNVSFRLQERSELEDHTEHLEYLS